jgi:hypothetical protein
MRALGVKRPVVVDLLWKASAVGAGWERICNGPLTHFGGPSFMGDCPHLCLHAGKAPASYVPSQQLVKLFDGQPGLL